MKKEIMNLCKNLGVEVYETPEIEAVLFEAKDIIATSDNGMIETPVIPLSDDIW